MNSLVTDKNTNLIIKKYKNMIFC